MKSLKLADWRVKFDRLAEELITSYYTDTAYFEGHECEKQRNSIKEIYDIAVKWNQLDIESIMCDIEDHDTNIIEEMAELIMENCDINAAGTYDEIKCGVAEDLSTQHNINVFMEYPIIGLTSIPYIVVKELMNIRGYYEIVYPPRGSWQEYRGENKCTIGYNDAQNVLFEGLVRYDVIFDSSNKADISVPVLVRPVIKPSVKLNGGEK